MRLPLQRLLPLVTLLWRSVGTVLSLLSKRLKAIQKGAIPEKAARRGYENAGDYFEISNKRILIQQRALACLSKSLAHILQGAVSHGQHWPAKMRGLDDAQEFALLAYSFVQVPISQGWRRLPPSQRHP